MESLSSTASVHVAYDVFLSFRGEDTRDNFISHLYADLRRKKIKTFIDDRLERGNEISRTLQRVIRSSKLSVIVFSERYANSSWCLDELVSILRCKEEKGQVVIPVFYRIDPSNVRKQQGSYAAAFSELEDRYGDRMDKVQEWRNALTSVANLAGWDSFVIRPESKLVEVIVGDIVKKLNSTPSLADCKGLIGIENRIEQIETLLCIGALDIKVVGIWGLGGIGKTTLASVIYHRYSSHFEGCCFLTNIRAESKKNGLNYLQNKLLSDLLEEENKMYGLEIRSISLNDRLRCKKMLIVLDDASDVEHFDVLVGDHDRFGLGTRIIITSRDLQVLKGIVNDGIYKVKALNRDEARQLFRLNVSKENHSMSDCTEVLEKAIDYAKGVPLALKVLSSSLRGKNKEEWESALTKLKVMPNTQIYNVLRVSYDALDDIEKDIFLDIACFFKGEDRDSVERILDGCGFFAKIGISVLVDKSLLHMVGNKLWMHDLLEEMGFEIVRQQSIKEPGKRSRLWIAEDVCHVLKNNTGTASVEGMFLDMSKIRGILPVRPEVFAKVYNLRVLKIYNCTKTYKLDFPRGLQSLPCALRYLHWESYPLKTLPFDFNPQNLVELKMPRSLVEKLWNGVQNLEYLKKIDLSHSEHLIQIPDLSDAPKESINIGFCTSLPQVSSHLKYFYELKNLCLEGCFSIANFPDLPRNIKCLYLGWTIIKQVPPSIGRLSHLEILCLKNCKSLENLPTDICNLTCLSYLNLSGCSNLESFPEIMKPMGCLLYLSLDGTKIKEIPLSIKNMTVLERLNLKMCKNLELIPSSIYELNCLKELILSSCLKLEKLPYPSIYKCSFLLRNLKYLDISNCKNLRSLPGFPVFLESFDAHGCTSLETVSSYGSRDVPTQGWDCDRIVKEFSFSSAFSFSNCRNLDEHARNTILADARLRILRQSALSLMYDRILFSVQSAYHVDICYPENKIPKWFNNQSEGSSINIKLPLRWYRQSFLGFALSIVASFDNHRYDPYFTFQYKFNFKASNGISRECFGRFPNSLVRKTKILNSEHLFLWYEPKGYHFCGQAVEMSFECYTAYVLQPPVETCRVRRCGIRLLYAKDATRKRSSIKNDTGDS